MREFLVMEEMIASIHKSIKHNEKVTRVFLSKVTENLL